MATVPTKQEIDEKVNKTLEEAEKLQEEADINDETDDLDEQNLLDEKKHEEEKALQEEVTEEKEESPAKKEPSDDPTDKKIESLDVDYKKKYSESAKENQRIFAKNRKINKAVIEANTITVTEEDLISEYGDKWNEWDDVDKKVARDNLINTRRFALINAAVEEGEKIEKWNDSIDAFLDNPETFNEYPELDGKQKEFAEFAKQTKYQGAMMDLLVPAFIGSQTKRETNGSLMETPTSSKEDPQIKPTKISIAEARRIRVHDYNKWKQLMKDGKIESEV